MQALHVVEVEIASHIVVVVPDANVDPSTHMAQLPFPN